MARHLTGTAAQMTAARSAMDANAGLPLRALRCVQVGRDGVARDILPYPLPLTYQGEPTPGWTSHVLAEPVVESPGRAALEVPAEYESHLGMPGVPAVAALVFEDDLPVPLRTAVRARRGQNPDGTPMDPPGLPVQAQAPGKSSLRASKE